MLTVGEIQRITKGKVVGGKSLAAVKGVSINSRTIKKGHLFIAVKGARFDGHDFIRSAIRKGAGAVVVSKRIVCSLDIAVIVVKDTTKALGQIAAWHRRQFNIPIVAITGSTGKTTTKEMVAAVLGKRFKVLKNDKTENNQFGVPLTLLKLKPSHTIAVLELGTNQPGDICTLAKIVRPTVAIFTNIGESHLERLKTQEGIFTEKAQLIKHVDPHGIIIFNGDDRYLKQIAKKRGSKKIIRFGVDQRVDCRAHYVALERNARIHFMVKRVLFTINSPAAHNLYNALAAISCGLAFKIRYNDIVAALARLRLCDGRQEIAQTGRLWLIDDTYNANPISFTSAVNTLNTLNIKGKRIVVCADMLELGARSKALHESVGKMMAQSAVDAVLTTGRYARHITRGFNCTKGGKVAVHCADLKEVHRRLKAMCHPGDAVLVKGSRGMHMERTVKFLKKYFSR